jgi:predicted RNA methylase
VEPRFGRLYASAVLRPLAEQVLDALGARPGDTVCDVMCDGGTLGVALGRAVGGQGHVVLVDTDAARLQAASGDVSATGCVVSTEMAVDGINTIDDASFDRVASLCTFGFWEGGSMLDVAERAMRPAGSAAVLTWDAAQSPAHEVALADALRDVTGIQSGFLTQCLAAPDARNAARWEPITLNDVVRFDGINAYWAAMVVERPLAFELARESDETLSAVRASCQRALAPWTAADGTIRIPVRAALWCCRPGARG